MSPNGNGTDTIPPWPASLANALLRNATIRAASSNDNAPATTAAAISPCECPTTAAGSTPNERHNAANDTITANNTGCTTSTRPNATESPNTSRNDQPTNGANASSHASIDSANTRDESHKPKPIPTHCEP
jgi:hypothetical protein